MHGGATRYFAGLVHAVNQMMASGGAWVWVGSVLVLPGVHVCREAAEQVLRFLQGSPGSGRRWGQPGDRSGTCPAAGYFLEGFPIHHEPGRVAVVDEGGIMTHHHHGDVAVTLPQDHVSIDVAPVLLVQAAERLVKEQELASPHQRAPSATAGPGRWRSCDRLPGLVTPVLPGAVRSSVPG